MTESLYRIVAKIDPQTSTGKAKVKQDLIEVEREAGKAGKALNQAFNQGQFDKTIQGLNAHLERLANTMTGVAGDANKLRSSNETLGQSLDRLAAANAKATASTSATTAATRGASSANDSAATNATKYQAALMRVLQATDQQAAEQQRLNNLLTDSKRLLDAKIISEERHAQVLALVNNAGKEQAAVSGMQRMGYQQLGFQANDMITMYSLGARPTQIFASQMGQVVQATQLALGGTSKFAAFLMGPWGIAASIAVIALIPLIGKLLEQNNALDAAIDKMRKEAEETELNRKAKEAYSRTLEGQIALQREMTAELEKSSKSQRQQRQEALNGAQSLHQDMMRSRGELNAEIDAARKRVDDLNKAIAAGPPLGATDATSYMQGLLLAATKAEEKVKGLQEQARQADAAISEQAKNIRRANAEIIESQVEAATDPLVGIRERYGAMADAARDAYTNMKTSAEQYRAEMDRIAKAQAQAEAAERNRANAASSGVATFRSREQAIGIAGRELQRAGLRVSENDQFGGVKGQHKSAGHGKYAIDINSGTGVVEADVPDLRAKFDQLARRYQARGYRVLWNGKIYEANGDGPSGSIPSGQHQHRDHMHVEAPSTIVGKATQASTEAQAGREDNEVEKREARAADFISGAIAKAASAGLPNNAKAQLAADIDEMLAEFERRFDRAPNIGEKMAITGALTDADARQTAQRFTEAYVQPLERLQALQGKTGIDREILNRKLEETARLGRDLTPVEEAQIETFVRGNDELSRKAAILEALKQPINDYKSEIAALNALLADGLITQEQYNLRLSDMGKGATEFKAGLLGQNSQGESFADAAAREAADRQRDEQLVRLQEYLAQGTILEEEAAAIRAAIWRQHANQMMDIDHNRFDNAKTVLNQLAQLQNSKSREISAIGKAAAVTQATIDAYVAINKALASLPPPFNAVMAAAIGATAFANVSNIMGLKDGGYVSGPGGPRSDSVPANLSNGEFVVNADATARNRALLEAINSGRSMAGAQQGASAGPTPGASANGPAADVAPSQPQAIRIVNVVDPKMVADFMATPDGEQVFVNMLNNNQGTIRQLVGGGS